MKSDILADAIGQIQDDYIIDADCFLNTENGLIGRDNATDRDPGNLITVSHKKPLIRYAVAAACLCLFIAGGIVIANRIRHNSTAMQQWSASMSAGDYFANSGKKGSSASMSSSASLIMMPYAIALSLDDSREDLENNGVIPLIPDHPEHSFRTAYNGDGSLYNISFLWMRRGSGIEEYSDLTFTAAPKELHEVSDVITVRTDLLGNEIPPYVSATQRDGITILA